MTEGVCMQQEVPCTLVIRAARATRSGSATRACKRYLVCFQQALVLLDCPRIVSLVGIELVVPSFADLLSRPVGRGPLDGLQGYAAMLDVAALRQEQTQKPIMRYILTCQASHEQALSRILRRKHVRD